MVHYGITVLSSYWNPTYSSSCGGRIGSSGPDNFMRLSQNSKKAIRAIDTVFPCVICVNSSCLGR
ncbi:hypothetical protein I79_000836 [Cricetulus griseus]|uniref:Uncharacterized protein n=1 Tax=Cricetulus griseus TaxID=10029 RepID=G3GT62_CRIGR|nr:hypothetical protein I79_000836 [Cricetulus griseus]